MKKITLIMIIIFIVTLAMVACSDGNGPDDRNPPGQEPSENDPVVDDPGNGEPDDPVDEDPATPDTFSFKVGDFIIEMDQEIETVISRIGEPLGKIERPSCAFDGIDIIFSYPGIQIYTYPVGNGNYIHTIGLFDDTVRTAEGGIRLGHNIQRALDFYGDDYSYETGMYKYMRGLTALQFLVEDEIIIGITYRLLLDL